MSLIHQAIDLFLHLDKHLNAFASAHQLGVYLLLAVIVFCETGLVVWPFLPGDSLLFAIGALAASDNAAIHLTLAIPLLCLCANCGDMLNYSIGFRIGPKIFSRQKTSLLNPKHLAEAHTFYEKHGRMTIILARFVPIVRTFAPFVAGIGQMPFARFIGFSVAGGVLWVVLLTLAGFYFNHIAWVRDNFQIVVVAIVFISVIPVGVHSLRASRRPVLETP